MEKMVLEMPSENRQCQGRGNMGGQPIPDMGNGFIKTTNFLKYIHILKIMLPRLLEDHN